MTCISAFLMPWFEYMKNIWNETEDRLYTLGPFSVYKKMPNYKVTIV